MSLRVRRNPRYDRKLWIVEPVPTAAYPLQAVATLEKDADVLLTFFDFPAEHWKHLSTANLIESPFATVRLRQRVTKGAGSRTKGLLMAHKLLDIAQARWRRLDGAHLLPLVRAGVFVDGVQQASKRSKPRARAASRFPCRRSARTRAVRIHPKTRRVSAFVRNRDALTESF